MISLISRLVGVSVLLLSFNAHAQNLACESDNPNLQAMGKVKVHFARADGSSFEIIAKLADNNQTRAAGFQKVCPSVIENQPIFFLYTYRSLPGFICVMW